MMGIDYRVNGDFLSDNLKVRRVRKTESTKYYWHELDRKGRDK